MDNKTSKAVKEKMMQTDDKYQSGEPNNYQADAAKCAIQMIKHHFIIDLYSTDLVFQISLWDTLLFQAFIILNLPHTLQSNPKLSAYAQLEGKFDYSKTLLALLSTKVLLYRDLDTRSS